LLTLCPIFWAEEAEAGGLGKEEEVVVAEMGVAWKGQEAEMDLYSRRLQRQAFLKSRICFTD
jgi:hypothetical protein